MILSLRKNGLDSLFKEVRVFKVIPVKVLEMSLKLGFLGCGLSRHVQVRRPNSGLFLETTKETKTPPHGHFWTNPRWLEVA